MAGTTGDGIFFHACGPGDFDCDGDVDLVDFAAWPDCMTGPDAGPVPTGCEAVDFDMDDDVDLPDFAAFQALRTAG